MSDRVSEEARRMARLPVRSADALARRVRRLRARRAAGGGAGVILYYHRIAAPAHDPWGIAVAPETFERHLRMLRERYAVMPLGELAAAARRGRVPPRALAVSFDDGYLDNLEAGLPLLEAQAVPATFYIATGYIGGDRLYWWDELQELLTGPGERPAALDLGLGGARIAAPTATPEERGRALTDVAHPVLRHSPPAATEAWLRLLREWAGDPPLDAAQRGRPLREDELARLAAGAGVEIGAHTVHHVSLLGLGPAAQREEIEGSRRFLAERLGAPPRGFSFPFGDNGPAARWIARSHGFDYAVGVREDMPVSPAARRFELPRLMPFEEPAEALAARIDALLGSAAGDG